MLRLGRNCIHARSRPCAPESGVAVMGANPRIIGADLERAIDLREQGWSFARIGREFGACETAASNAVTAALCPRLGHRPAQRDAKGNLLPEEMERLRLMLRKGLKGIEIQTRMAVSAACVAEQRRRYNVDLKARGKGLLPPPGNGEAYSGARIPKEKRAEVERLLLTGIGGPKVSDATGVSKTQVVRIRTKLVKRLKRKGETLPGCDTSGKRLHVFGSAREIPPEARDQLRAMILNRVPVKRAAQRAAIGLSSAYRIRDELRAEVEARGEALPAPKLPGRVKPSVSRFMALEGVPGEQIFRLRKLAKVHGAEEARRIIAAELAAERNRPLTFEEKLARVRSGEAGVVATFRPHRADPQGTLGGVTWEAV